MSTHSYWTLSPAQRSCPRWSAGRVDRCWDVFGAGRANPSGGPIRLPRDHGHLALPAGSYSYIRQFAPKVLEAVRFAGGTDAKPLIEALGILRELNTTGARNVPDGAPTGTASRAYGWAKIIP
ncbi:hypothetical protein AB0J63_48855 [Streptosporangium canum]|uniref:hypothetical protein n=1 Tax=Streptosporangium canum TaxID=324952 RepID=UPI003428CF63